MNTATEIDELESLDYRRNPEFKEKQHQVAYLERRYRTLIDVVPQLRVERTKLERMVTDARKQYAAGLANGTELEPLKNQLATVQEDLRLKELELNEIEPDLTQAKKEFMEIEQELKSASGKALKELYANALKDFYSTMSEARECNSRLMEIGRLLASVIPGYPLHYWREFLSQRFISWDSKVSEFLNRG